MKFMRFLPVVLASALLFNSAQAADNENNVHFSGALVAEPCTLPDSETNITLDFGSVIMKSLYQYQRTHSQAFNIHLEECDPSLMKTVSVTFNGTADDELNTLLALDPTSSAKGVAIGLELPDGSPLAINKPSPYQQLTTGNNTLTFNAYVQIKPQALASKTITPGDFIAISTFVLGYQ